MTAPVLTILVPDSIGADQRHFVEAAIISALDGSTHESPLEGRAFEVRFLTSNNVGTVPMWVAVSARIRGITGKRAERVSQLVRLGFYRATAK